ncbi:DNA repair protein XRCC4 [Trinorchestia longiramus]|nr:DNA repair protein XRCC4 [Trinorchestia longiramus]
MVLSFVKYESIQNATNEIFIHTDYDFDQSDFTLTVLLTEKAFSSKISRSSSFVNTWSQRLKLTPEEYLKQFLVALQEQSKHSSPQNSFAKDENSTKNDHNVEHVFQVNKSVLTWKQYFPDKQIYGKRGAVPLQESDYTSTVWKLLQESVLKHSEAQNQICKLESANANLKNEVARALSLVDESLRAKNEFQQQNYTKFCALINAKKEKIRQLEEALQSAPGPSSGPNSSSTAVASSSVTAATVDKKRPNITVISRGEPTQKPGARNSDDDYDDDTDVDEVTQCDTDEENEEIKSRKRLMSTTRGKTKNREMGLQAASGSKREAPDESSQSFKKASFGDSQDDLFNSSVEGASLALLSNIKPRETATAKVSHSSSLSNFDESKIYRGRTANNADCGDNLRVISNANRYAKQEDRVQTDEDDPASVVARVLRKNALIRKTKGIDMPRRVDDFDVHLENREVNEGIRNLQHELDSNRRMSWAIDVAGEMSAGPSFLGDAGHCDSSQDADRRPLEPNINAPVPTEISQREPIAQPRENRREELTTNDVLHSSKFSSVDEGSSSLTDGNFLGKGSNSSKGGRQHESKVAQDDNHSSASDIVPKYEMDTQLSRPPDPASDDSVVILDDSGTDAPANLFRGKLSCKNGIEERNVHQCSKNANDEMSSSASTGEFSSKKLIEDGISEVKQSSECDSQASQRSSKRCSYASRTPRKKTRVLELDLTEHAFRSGSIIEEILM